MKTVTIPENEYLNMQETINALQQQLQLLKDKEFITKLNLAYQFFVTSNTSADSSSAPISIKRGSGKHIVKYIADDFTAPLDDFQDYTRHLLQCEAKHSLSNVKFQSQQCL